MSTFNFNNKAQNVECELVKLESGDFILTARKDGKVVHQKTGLACVGVAPANGEYVPVFSITSHIPNDAEKETYISITKQTSKDIEAFIKASRTDTEKAETQRKINKDAACHEYEQHRARIANDGFNHSVER